MNDVIRYLSQYLRENGYWFNSMTSGNLQRGSLIIGISRRNVIVAFDTFHPPFGPGPISRISVNAADPNAFERVLEFVRSHK